ncbi:MAG: hypothetical protein ACM32O_13515 [Clostridia bacterium]
MTIREIKWVQGSKTITVPVGSQPTMILIEPQKEKASIIPLIEHGDVVVKCYQGKITGFDERKSYRL